MKMSQKEMVQLLNIAKEDDEQLEELGDTICEIIDDDKKVNTDLIEALFKIHERLKDPAQSLFNALEACVMSSQERTTRKLARESVMRKPNYCNLQLVGDGPKSIELLKEISNRTDLDRSLRKIVKEILEEA